MGRRKIFTKREYEKLSKTHEGRQKINTTYLGWGIFGLASGIIFILIGFIAEYMFPLTMVGIVIAFICFFVVIIYSLAYKHENAEELARLKAEEERLERLRKVSMEQIDEMEGFQFEEYCATILSDLGYQTQLTKKSGDYGVDIILERSNEKIIVQTKRYSKKVSVRAIQEVSAARDFYGTYNAWVITNNYFTDSAKNLAQVNDIKLFDRDRFSCLIEKSRINHPLSPLSTNSNDENSY